MIGGLPLIPTTRLYSVVQRENILIEWTSFGSSDLLGLYYVEPALKSPIIGLHQKLKKNERLLRCVLAHELGHHFRSAGTYITAACETDKLMIAKADQEADSWALDLLLPCKSFVEMLKRGLSIGKLADDFFVTEDFVCKKLEQLERRGFKQLISTSEGTFIFYSI